MEFLQAIQKSRHFFSHRTMLCYIKNIQTISNEFKLFGYTILLILLMNDKHQTVL